MNDNELKACLTQIRDGNKSAFALLYEDMKRPVWSVAYRILLDQNTAEDVTQDVFVKLFRSPPDTSVQSPRAWIFRIARNRAIDVLRQKQVEPIDEEAPEHEDRMDSLVTRLDVESALARLEPRQREILTLHLHAELSFAAIAPIVGLSLPATYRSYRKALNALKSHLNGEIK